MNNIQYIENNNKIVNIFCFSNVFFILFFLFVINSLLKNLFDIDRTSLILSLSLSLYIHFK